MTNPGTAAAFEEWKAKYTRNLEHAQKPPPLHTSWSEKWPPRPDIFDEVKLGPFVSETDAKLAHRVWSLPDNLLGEAWRGWKDRPLLASPNHDTVKDVLVRNVYELIMCDPLIPVPRKKAAAKFVELGLQKTWSGPEIIAPFKDGIIRESVVHNMSSWTVETIEAQLQERGVSTERVPKRADLERLLIQNELEAHCGVMPRTNLSHWGIRYTEKYALQPVNKVDMSPIDMYTFAIHLSPYNPSYWVSRAFCHYQQAFFDLAIGDAYRAMLLCDVLTKRQERMRQPGLYPRVWHAIEQHLLVDPREGETIKDHVQYLRHKNGLGVNQFLPSLQKSLQHIISLSLMALGAWNDYNCLENLFSTDIPAEYRDSRVPRLQKEMAQAVEPSYFQCKEKQTLYHYEYYQGVVSADKEYPYALTRVAREEQGFLDILNMNLFQQDEESTNPERVYVASERGPGLGVYAKQDIKVGDLIYYEEPVIRGHLPIRHLSFDPQAETGEARCENCMRVVVRNGKAKLKHVAKASRLKNPNICKCFNASVNRPIVDVPVFCKLKSDTHEKEGHPKSCLEIAKDLFHFDSCGKNWGWLYDAMQSYTEQWYKHEHIGHNNECQGTVLSLLLKNVFEITLHRRKENPTLSPHEIHELLVLEDGVHSWGETQFPFSMTGNIIVPFDILTYLGVDIFRDLSFDTWIIQTVMRKLLTNAIPWDLDRQGNQPDFLQHDMYKPIPEWAHQGRRIKTGGQRYRDLDPSFPNLYLFPGLSLFNHACRKSHNADWGYDTTVPNRVTVWAATNIKKGEEIRIRYRYGKFKSLDRAGRVLGRPCDCDGCKSSKLDTNSPPHEESSDAESEATRSSWTIERFKRPSREEEAEAQKKHQREIEEKRKEWRRNRMFDFTPEEDKTNNTSLNSLFAEPGSGDRLVSGSKRKTAEDPTNSGSSKRQSPSPTSLTSEHTRRDKWFAEPRVHRRYKQHVEDEVRKGRSEKEVKAEMEREYREAQKKRVENR